MYIVKDINKTTGKIDIYSGYETIEEAQEFIDFAREKDKSNPQNKHVYKIMDEEEYTNWEEN